MSRHFAFLRSMNVGGRRVTNDELVALVAGLGLAEVAAYQAAGNLTFVGDTSEQALCDALSEGLGYAVPVMMRTADELAAIAGARPFTEAEHAASQGKVQVSLLAAHPPDDAVAEVLAMQTEEDRLRIDGQQLYWLPKGGMSSAELDVLRIEKLLGMQTRRTQGTLQRFLRKYA
ncbi:MAG: DUF1697 domain-containing protein [Deltaproteobacteria bacterium]|nr:MAG: DUF1697 domain-containing protein [Deltaproteobacteria bacterium]